MKLKRTKKRGYFKLRGAEETSQTPIEFGRLNGEYLEALKCIAEYMREIGHASCAVVMSPALKEMADTNGASARIEAATGLPIVIDTLFPDDIIGVITLNKVNGSRMMYPGLVCPF